MPGESTSISRTAGEATRIYYAYLQAEEAGLAPDRRRILEMHPHIAPLLDQFFSLHDLARGMPVSSVNGESAGTAWPPDPPFVVIPSQDARLSGGFEILEKLGSGGTGTVYRARVNGLTGEPDTAIKLFRHGLNLDMSQRLRDALVLKGLDHSNLARVYAAGESMTHGPFLATEYVPGCDLAKWLKDHGPLDERQAAGILRTLAEALHAAHDKDVLHLDLKPDNVFGCYGLLAGAALKIGDFGLGRFVGETESLPADGRSFATGGTTGYMAPEQYWGSSSRRSDIYALGALLLCMVGDADPMHPGRMRNRFLNVEQLSALESLRTPEVHRLEIPAKMKRVQETFRRHNIAAAAALIREPQLRAIITRCLAIEPGDRYQTAAELANDLSAWLENRPLVHAGYTYTKRARLRMLVERCRRGRSLEDHTKLWGIACLIIGAASIGLSALGTALVLLGFNETVSRQSTSWAFIAIWMATSVWTLFETRFRSPIAEMILSTVLYFFAYLNLRFLLVLDSTRADSIQVLIAGLLVACIGLGNRYGRLFFYFGVATISLSYPIALLLQRPACAPLGPMIVGSAMGLPLLFFGVSTRRLRSTASW